MSKMIRLNREEKGFLRAIITIAIILLLEIILLYFLKPNKKILNYYSGSGLTLKDSLQGQINSFYEREFSWNYPVENVRKTIFRIDKKILENEIAHFGLISEKPKHPFFLKKRGFIVSGEKRSGSQLIGHKIEMEISIDYRQIYERNLSLFSEHSRTLFVSSGVSAEKDPLYPFLAFVQQIRYAVPPEYYRNKFIGSFFIPLLCLYEKYADCDSKSVLLAVFLNSVKKFYLRGGNEEKLALILIHSSRMKHVLLAIKRTPLPAMTYLYEQKKGYFIIVEVSYPGWFPGFASNEVIDELKNGNFILFELN